MDRISLMAFLMAINALLKSGYTEDVEEILDTLIKETQTT